MILHFGMTSFPDTMGQAVHKVIHLSRLTGFDRPVQEGKCLL
jgi:hypothetical protein